MQGVYLCSFYARHENYNMVYNDVEKKTKPDLLCSATRVDLRKFDYIIATPPCNYWSHASSEKQKSEYARKTKHLLPCLISLLSNTGKPFIIENVRNVPKMTKNKVFDLANKKGLYVHFVGRHTYFTNILCNLETEQKKDYKTGGKRLNKRKGAQGGENVHKVIEIWLKQLHI